MISWSSGVIRPAIRLLLEPELLLESYIDDPGTTWRFWELSGVLPDMDDSFRVISIYRELNFCRSGGLPIDLYFINDDYLFPSGDYFSILGSGVAKTVTEVLSTLSGCD